MKVKRIATLESPFRSPAQRAVEREGKREAVLRAAVKVFNARGFHATSLDEVASTLGVSKPTVYHYLGNKEQILLECVMRGLLTLQQAVNETRGVSGTGLDRLRAFLVTYAEQIMDDFGRCVIRTGDEELSPNGAIQFRALKREIDKTMRVLIRQGISDGSITVADVRLTAFTLAGALNWTARWYAVDGKERPSTVARHMVDILIAGLAAR